MTTDDDREAPPWQVAAACMMLSVNTERFGASLLAIGEEDGTWQIVASRDGVNVCPFCGDPIAEPIGATTYSASPALGLAMPVMVAVMACVECTGANRGEPS